MCTYDVANGRDDGLVDERNDDVFDVDDTDDDDVCGDDDDNDDGHPLPHAYTLTHFIIIIIIIFFFIIIIPN